jgi:hypothetical protein
MLNGKCSSQPDAVLSEGVALEKPTITLSAAVATGRALLRLPSLGGECP